MSKKLPDFPTTRMHRSEFTSFMWMRLERSDAVTMCWPFGLLGSRHRFRWRTACHAASDLRGGTGGEDRSRRLWRRC
jgi:hypothetical protein